MLPKYFSYYNYKITQNIDIPILFFTKIAFLVNFFYKSLPKP